MLGVRREKPGGEQGSSISMGVLVLARVLFSIAVYCLDALQSKTLHVRISSRFELKTNFVKYYSTSLIVMTEIHLK